jgi:hypothetical protein
MVLTILLADVTRLAMAVALQDVAADRCPKLAVDPAEKAALMQQFHQYDVGGINSMVSPPLNTYYAEFLDSSRADLAAFCGSAATLAGRAGYPGLLNPKK